MSAENQLNENDGQNTEELSEIRLNPYEGDEPYIFVSYAHKNKGDVMPVLERLNRDGYRFWYDGGIIPASHWSKEIANNIYRCDYFLAFISKDYIVSEYCDDEIHFAKNNHKPILCIYLKEDPFEFVDEKVKIEFQMSFSKYQAIFKLNIQKKIFLTIFTARKTLQAVKKASRPRHRQNR